MITRIVGVTFNNDETGENRQDIISELKQKKQLIFGQEVELTREPGNQYDGNAIAVIGPDHRKLGYIKREISAEFAPLMDNGAKTRAFVRHLLGDGEDYFYGIEIALGIIEESEPAEEK